MDEILNTVPKYGWKVKLNHEFPQKRTQFRIYRLGQIIPLIVMVARYLIDYISDWFHGSTPNMDYIYPASCDQQSGVPLGGIGGGTIGRGFRGEFSRYQMIPGVYEYPSTTISAAQFIVNIQDMNNNTLYQKVLSSQRKPNSELSSWEWDFPGEHGEYTALYPRAWTVFDIPEQEMKLICRQISPVIPNNYKDSSIPGCVFCWTALNYSNEAKNVSITFTFESGIGIKKDKTSNIKIQSFNKIKETCQVEGILFKQDLPCRYSQPFTYGLAALKKDSVKTSSLIFNPTGDGKTFWNKLKLDGILDDKPIEYSGSEKMGCGLCCKSSINGNNSSEFVFTLTWDNPLVFFPKSKNPLRRYYTNFFNDSGNIAPDLCLYCIENFPEWEKRIDDWQAPILENKDLPDWYKSAVFNELYYMSDGGSTWVQSDDDNLALTDPRREYGRFFYLEGHEYRMCNTYDVHFYASSALVALWPQLQLVMQYDFKDAIPSENHSIVWFLYNGEKAYRKKKNTVPHDLGDPKECPYSLINSYNIHDVSNWRDLPLKFVLQVYRDYVVTKNTNYLVDMFPQAANVMSQVLSWTSEEDGMIKNSGRPDQTYDAWTMSGVSSYCGGLWIATLVAFVEMAKIMKNNELVERFSAILKKAKDTFEEKLWNGEYYNFDSSGGSHSNSIMADQLCGLWYLHLSSVNEKMFPPENVQKALKKIYSMNVCKYYDGVQGAVNGMLPDGTVDRSAVQSEEVWTGVTYALASLMIYEGLKEEGFQTAKGLYETLYDKSGLGFATPEAIVDLKAFRALSYMRPLSIWSMQLALEKNQNSV